jgi:GAF domain-containing protein
MSTLPADQDVFKSQLDQMTRRLLAVERRAKTLAELNRLLSQGSDPLALAQRAVDLVMRATGAASTYIYLWDPEIERLVMRVATRGSQAAYVGEIQLRLGEGITGWCGLMRQTVVVNDDIQRDPRSAFFPALEEDGFRSMVAMPIAVPGGELLGVFTLWAAEPDAFDSNDVDLATEVGSLLASGLVHAQTLEDLRRQSAAARFLSTVPADATSSLRRCADVLADAVREQLDATLCVVELADRGSTDGPLRPALAFTDHVDPSIIVASRSVRYSADLPALVRELGPGLGRFTTSFGTLCPLGAITCFRRRPFTEADSAMLEALGAQAAALVASLDNPAMAIPLAGRLAAAPTRESADRMLRDLGWKPGPTHPVLVRIRSAQYSSPAAFDHLVDALRELCASLNATVMVPSAPFVTILLQHGPEQPRGFEHALRNMLRYLRAEPGKGVSAGIGPLAANSRDLMTRLEQAEAALAWADLIGSSTPIVHYEDVKHLRLLPKIATDVGEELGELLARFSEVMRYDLRHGTSLTNTLDVFLAKRCSVTDTANELCIHRNTLRQRLGRIEELSGRPIEEVGDWTVAALAARLSLARVKQLTKTQSRAPREADEPGVELRAL